MSFQRNHPDHRRALRVSMTCAMQVQPLNPPTPDAALCSRQSQSRDLSESGMQLWAEHPCPVRSQVLVTFECEKFGEILITSRVGVVIWMTPHAIDHGNVLGVHFEDDWPPSDEKQENRRSLGRR